MHPHISFTRGFDSRHLHNYKNPLALLVRAIFVCGDEKDLGELSCGNRSPIEHIFGCPERKYPIGVLVL